MIKRLRNFLMCYEIIPTAVTYNPGTKLYKFPFGKTTWELSKSDVLEMVNQCPKDNEKAVVKFLKSKRKGVFHALFVFFRL